MMQIVYFSQKEQFLTEMGNLASDMVYVTPSPSKADGLRTRLAAKNSHDVITIAKFTSELVEHLWANQEMPVVKRKAELLLIFGILKNKYLPDLGYEQFTQAYNLFSDLRSFTLDEDTLTSVLEEQPAIIRQVVSLFWKLLSLTGFLDEHGAYQQIAEKLRSSEEIKDLNKTYIFWGFQHLNGQQVDLLKALAIRYKVIIPFPGDLRLKLKKSDWISWLMDARTSETELDFIPRNPKANWIPINTREISMHLKDLLKAQDQIVLGISKLSPLHLDIIPSNELSFKIPLQLVAAELKEVSRNIKKFEGNTIDLYQWFLKAQLKPLSLKHYKAHQLYLEALDSIEQLTDDEIRVDTFFLKLLSEVVSLNQPRTSYVPVSSKIMTMDLRDMSSLEDLDRNRRVILCVDERFDDIQGLGQNYTESIQKSLAVLGPLKRNELELQFKLWEFKDLFSRAEVVVLMGEGTLNHSLVWKRLFSEVGLDKIEKNAIVEPRLLQDHFKNLVLKNFTGSFSASKLQTFIDCPRKFYFSYIDKVFPNVILEKDFDPMTSGTIIHEIIEKYFKENLQDKDLSELTTRVMQIYINEKKLILPQEVYLQRELIFNHRAQNGIQFIRALSERISDKIEWKIEESFSVEENFKMKGRIDCMGVGERTLFLLDFKSTEFSASSNAEVVNYEAVQLWAYAHAAQNLVNDFDKKTIVLGYVVLDDPSKSNLLTDDEDLARSLKGLCKSHAFKDPFTQKIKEAQSRLTDLAVTISIEKTFMAAPRKATTCMYCELNKVCIKSEMADV